MLHGHKVGYHTLITQTIVGFNNADDADIQLRYQKLTLSSVDICIQRTGNRTAVYNLCISIESCDILNVRANMHRCAMCYNCMRS